MGIPIIIFITILALSFLLIFVGSRRYSEVPFVTMLGWTTLFLMGITLFTSGVDVKDGENSTEVFAYITNSTTLNTTSITTSDTFTNFQSNPIGFYLAIVSFFGFLGEILNLKRPNIGGSRLP